MFKAGSKKDTVIGAIGIKSALILSVADRYVSSIFIHTQPLPDIFTPPQI